MPLKRIIAALGLASFAFGSVPSGAQTEPAPGGPDTSEWECTQCPFEKPGFASDAEVGALHVSDSDARFGDFLGLDDNGGYRIASGSGRYVSGEWLTDITANDLGLDSREITIDTERPGRFALGLRYEALPRSLFDTTRSPFSTSGSALTLPTNWIRGGSSGTMQRLAASLAQTDLGFDTDTLGLRGRWRFAPAWDATLEYRRDQRDGRNSLAASFINTATLLPAPINDSTDTIDAALRWSGKRGSARLGFYGSYFSNQLLAVTWQNPFNPLVAGADVGRLALAPDNSFQQLQGNGVWRFGRAVQANATAAVGRMRQDDAFVPYTTNTLLPTNPLPRGSLDGRIDIRHFDLGLTTDFSALGRVFQTLRIKFNARLDERDNRTPIATFNGIDGESFAIGSRSNTPYGYERRRYSVTGDYDLRQLLRFVPANQRLTISGGWRRDDYERDRQEIRETSEDQGWGRLVYRPARWLRAAVKLGAANREIDTFDTTLLTVTGQNPLLRKYNLANREREYAEASFELSPLEPWSFSFGGSYATNDYIDSLVGLVNSRDRGAFVETSWSLSADASLYGRYGYERMTGLQRGSQAFSIADWSASTEDIFRSAGAGVRIDNIGQRLGIRFDTFFANSRGTIVTNLGVPPTATFPPLRTRMNGAALEVSFKQSAALTITAGLRYEHYDVDDFALDGVAVNTVPTLLTQGGLAYDYDIEVALLSFRYRFGADPAGETNAEPAADKPD
jgi:MtrB/PioB family decaheme-associated outer membrane protein